MEGIKMKRLPIGTQAFNVLRKDGAIYVDKTEHIYNLISNGRIYFLSRPRRFGKSLLISTLKELFKGNKEIFEGLYIYDKWEWTKKYPVINPLEKEGKNIK
jgi:predicted AAA+ superfamily ATPase